MAAKLLKKAAKKKKPSKKTRVERNKQKKAKNKLYDPANEPYLKNYMPELKPRTSLVFIIHQADLMASRIEFEKEWLPKFSNNTEKKPPTKKSKDDLPF